MQLLLPEMMLAWHLERYSTNCNITGKDGEIAILAPCPGVAKVEKA